jgi:VWFA-related protein
MGDMMATASKYTAAPAFFLLASITLLPAVTLAWARMPQTTMLRVSVSLVTVGVRVVDSKGREVPSLRASDFSLYEDGVAQRIEFFSSEEQPISLCILLDRSDSMGLAGKFRHAKTAAQLLVDTSHRESEYLFMAFDGNVPAAEFTRDRDQITRDVAGSSLGQGTSLYDAVVAALKSCRNAQHGRQALIVITDGADQNSTHTLNELIYTLQESRAQLYTIGYFSTPEDIVYRNSGPRVMLDNGQLIDNPRTVFGRLAKESGAEAFYPRSDKEQRSVAEQIAKDLRTQYTLAYYPSNPAQDGRYRQIKVQVRGGFSVRARQGYVLGNVPARLP